MASTAHDLGQAGLVGWRKKVGETVGGQVAERSRFTPEQVEAAVGVVFFALSAYYVVSTAVRAAKS